MTWSGAGSGGRYDVLVSADGGELQAWLTGVPGTSATFAAQPGHQYWFFVRATSRFGLQDSAMTAVVSG